MSHTTHVITDNDFVFSIDPFLKTIVYMGTDLITLTQGDHNSERLTFDMPRYVEGHDMSLCNIIEIHYTNTSSGASTAAKRSSDVYTVDDLSIKNNQDTVTFTWLVSKNATMYAGSLKFAVRFACIDGSEIEYMWSTGTFESITVKATINNTKTVAEQYSDTLQQWYLDLLTSKTEGLNAIEVAEQEATARIKAIDVVIEVEQETLDRVAAAGTAEVERVNNAGDAKISEIQSAVYTGETAAVEEEIS